ncbi:MAG: PstS family phosphate ABC transporter substrate-binding protein [Solirubrobacteraceae bacterium]
MRKPFAALLGLLALICVSGCGVSTRGAEREVPTVNLPAPTVSSPAVLRLAHRPPGVLIVDGSTQGSLTVLASRAYSAAGGSETVAIKDAGADVAFPELCRGQIDMVDSSRPISSTELAQCERAGIRPVQLEVASDAIVLATKAETDVGADCLTVAEVKAIFRNGSPVYNWGQLGFDQVPLSVAGPGPRNNAFEFFGQDVLGSPQPALLDFRFDYGAEPTGRQVRQFVTGSASDADATSRLTQLQQTVSTLRAILAGAQSTLAGANLYVNEASYQVTKGIADGRPPAAEEQDATDLADAQAKQNWAQGVVLQQSSELASARLQILAGRAAQRRLEADVGRLGIFRFSYYGLFEGFLRPLEITTSASPENCMLPSQQTVTSGAYPLSRQLLITTSLQDIEHGDVRDFLLSYLHNAQRLATQQGLVELPADVLGRETAFISTAGQQSASGSSATNVASTGASATAALPPTVH